MRFGANHDSERLSHRQDWFVVRVHLQHLHSRVPYLQARCHHFSCAIRCDPVGLAQAAISRPPGRSQISGSIGGEQDTYWNFCSPE